MSFNQSMSDKNETQYRRTGRSASSNQHHRGYSPAYPKGDPAAYDLSNAPERNVNFGGRDPRNSDTSFDGSLPASPATLAHIPALTQNVPQEKVLTEDRLRDMSLAAIKEFYSARDEKEVALCIKDLNSPSFHPSMISLWVADSFERKDTERDLLAKLLVNLTKSHDGTFSQSQLIKGFETVLSTLENAVIDAPRAPEFLGLIFAKVILENVVSLKQIGQIIYEGGEEPGHLLEVGLAGNVLGNILENIKSEKGESVLNEICTVSNLRLETFRPPDPLNVRGSRRMTTGLNGFSSLSEWPTYNPREELRPRYVPDRFAGPAAYDQSNAPERNVNFGGRDPRNSNHSFDRSLPGSPATRAHAPALTQNVPQEKVLTEDRLRDMSLAAIKEFYSARDEKEVALCIKDLNSPSFHPSMISLWVADSFERKDTERDLLAKLLVNLTKSHDGTFSQSQLIKGFETVLSTLENAVIDAPRAPEFLGLIFAKVILENVVSLKQIGQIIYEGGEEPGHLLEVGLAGNVLGNILENIKSEKGESVLNEICTVSNLRLETFRPPDPLNVRGSRRMTTGLNGFSSLSEWPTYNPREELRPRYVPDRFAGPAAYDQSNAPERNVNFGGRDPRNSNHSFDKSLPGSPATRAHAPALTQNVPQEKVLTEDRLRDMSLAAIKEFYSARDEKEVALCIKDLKSPSFHPSMISLWVTDSFERKDTERDLLAKLLVKLTESHDGTFSQCQLIKGFETVLSTLEDAVNDAPRAPEFLGLIFAKVILENVVSLKQIGQIMYEGGEEPGHLLEVGLAGNVLGNILEIIKSEKGDSVLKEIRTASNLQLETFRPP